MIRVRGSIQPVSPIVRCIIKCDPLFTRHAGLSILFHDKIIINTCISFLFGFILYCHFLFFSSSVTSSGEYGFRPTFVDD